MYRCIKCGKLCNDQDANDNYFFCTRKCNGELAKSDAPMDKEHTPTGIPTMLDIDSFPSVIALTINEYYTEGNPILKLWFACDLVELTLRFIAAMGLADLKKADVITPKLLRVLQSNIKAPTLGKWQAIVNGIFDELSNLTGSVPEAKDYVVDVLIPFIQGPSEKNKRNPENSFGLLRNRLTHGAGLTRNYAVKLVEMWTSKLDEIIAKLSWMTQLTVIVRRDRGALAVLKGCSVSPKPFESDDESITKAIHKCFEHGNETILLKDETIIVLWPMSIFGIPHIAEGSQFTPITEVPQIYSRCMEVNLQYTPIGSDEVCVSNSNESTYNAFMGVLGLDKPPMIAPSQDGTFYGIKGFEAYISKITKDFYGRSDEVQTIKKAIDESLGKIFWLPGVAGIGKTFIIAKVASELQELGHENFLILPYFFEITDVRCNRQKFLQFVIDRLLAWVLFQEYEDDPSRFMRGKPLNILKKILQSLTDKRVCFVLDGIDAINKIDFTFVEEVIFAHNLPNITWLCAGRPEGKLVELFFAANCVHLFSQGLPKMTKADIRTIIIEAIHDNPRLRKKLFGSDVEAADSINNPFIDRVNESADGLPLYVRFVVSDIQGGYYKALDAGEALPPSLENYFEILLKRCSIGTLHQILTPLVTTLASAFEPLTRDSLFKLMIRRTIISDSDEDREIFNKALNAVSSMIARKFTEEECEAYTIYHSAFKNHISHSETTRAAAKTATQALMLYCSEIVLKNKTDNPLFSYARRNIARHCYESGKEQSDYTYLFDTVSPRYLYTLYPKEHEQAYSDNLLCLQALAESREWNKPFLFTLYELLACSFTETLNKNFLSTGNLLKYFTNEQLMKAVAQGEKQLDIIPKGYHALSKLCMAELFLDSGELSYAEKLLEQVIDIPLSNWQGFDLGAFSSLKATNIDQHSAFLAPLRSHPLIFFIAKVSTHLPQVALRLSTRILSKRKELPNLCTFWTMIFHNFEDLPEDANLESLVQFIDANILEICTEEELRDFLAIYFEMTCRNKTRFSIEFLVGFLAKNTDRYLSFMKIFGFECVSIILLKSFTYLLIPPFENENYHQQMKESATALVNAIMQICTKRKDTPIRVGAYLLRLRHELGHMIEEQLFDYIVAHALKGIAEERAHPRHFIEPLSALFPIKPERFRQIFNKTSYSFVLSEDMQDYKKTGEQTDDANSNGKNADLTLFMTSSPGKKLSLISTRGSSREDMVDFMWSSKGMAEPKKIIITDPFNSVAVKGATFVGDQNEGNAKSCAFIKARRLLSHIQSGVAPQEILNFFEDDEQVGMGSILLPLLDSIIIHITSTLCQELGESARPFFTLVKDSLGDKNSFYHDQLWEALLAVGDIQYGRNISEAQHQILIETAKDVIANDDFGFTMLGWAAKQRFDTVLDIVYSFDLIEMKVLFWLMFMRNIPHHNDRQRDVAKKRIIELAQEIRKESDFVNFMLTVIFIEDEEVYSTVKSILDDWYYQSNDQFHISINCCFHLIYSAQDIPRLCSNPIFLDTFNIHLDRIHSLLSSDCPESGEPFDDDANDKEKAENFKNKLGRFRSLLLNFIDSNCLDVHSLAEKFRFFVDQFDDKKEWLSARVVLFPDQIDDIRSKVPLKIEQSREILKDAPDHLQAVGTIFFESVSRKFLKNQDPIGIRLADSFKLLARIHSHTKDVIDRQLIIQLLDEVPESANTTIAYNVFKGALNQHNCEMAHEWLDRTGTLIQEHIKDIEEIFPDETKWLPLSVKMLSLYRTPEMLYSFADLLANSCVDQGETYIAEMVRELKEFLKAVL